MSETTFTFRVDEALKNEFANAAKARDRTGAQLLRDFLASVPGGHSKKRDGKSAKLSTVANAASVRRQAT